MPDHFQYDVFLCHNHADKPRVRRLAERLKAAGVRVWLDDWVIKAGDIISLKVDEGLEQSRVLLLCISPAALASGWVALERSTAVHRDPANAGRRFIPLLLGDCDLPDTLRRYKYVDFREESEAAFTEVLNFSRVPSEEVPTVSPPPPAKKSRPSPIEKLLGQKPAEQPAASQPEPKKPLAVLECKLPTRYFDVFCLRVSPDGRWAATSADVVDVWDLHKGELKTCLLRHLSRYVRAVEITADGNYILSTDSQQACIKIWDATTYERLGILQGHNDEVWGLAALTASNRILSGAWDKTLKLWNVESGECLTTQTSAGKVLCVAVNRDDSGALSGSEEGHVEIWGLSAEASQATLTSLLSVRGHAGAVNSVAVMPDGKYGASASNDKTIKVWDIQAQRCSGTLEGHGGAVTSVALSPDSSILASTGSHDGTIRLWSFPFGVCLQSIISKEHSMPLSVVFSPDGSRLLVGFVGGGIVIYNLSVANAGLFREPARRYLNAKVVLLGEGTVGKTSLAHRLTEDKYVVRDRTHGMNVWRLDLPQIPLTPSLSAGGGEGEDNMEREALLWDLAGQEDYRLIHQLFLEETALALLLINPQKEDPFVEAGDWLKALKTAATMTSSAREAARLLVFSQIDVGGMKVSDAKIKRFCEQHGFADWLPTSAKTGENCSDKENGGHPSKLKQLIAGSIPWDKLPWTSTPRLLAELKNAVMAMRDESDIRLLRFAELSQRLEQALRGEKFVESDLRTAVTLLANHGLARPLKFGDLVLLRPDLINGYAGAVIRAARAHTDEIGCVLEADIYRPDFDFTGVDRLKNRPDEELLLRALVQTFLDHSLCIAEDTPHGRHLVFPSQYRREKDTPKHPDIFVSYTFGGEWQTVWTTLVVRLWYSQEFAHRELWRNAAEFASAKGHTLGLLIEKEADGAATISLYFDVEVPDELKVLFIEYVHRHLARYACDVARDRRYVCAGCKRPFKDLDLIRELLAEKQTTIVCQKCRTEVELIDFIEQRLKSDPVARKILAMDEKTTRAIDTQALEQILIGHMMAIAGEANQIFRPVTMFDHGIDGEVEFKDNDGKASGKRIYIQLKSGNSYLRTRKGDGSEVFDVTNDRHLEYWISQPVDVYLVIRQKDEMSGDGTIRWMNVTRYLKNRKDKKSRQILFVGEKLDMEAVWKARDGFFPPAREKARK
jgi:GTPase SAR1 family protein/DNA-directed RNA polymerase subunit RPC12/RpoP